MTDSKNRIYFCIDMKTFYASVECAERGLNPFQSNLAVADITRGKNALCLAISPLMKALGVKNRCRLSDIPENINYETAPPRMSLYIEYAADIYDIYLNYFKPEDIHVYSIDEAFIDATAYLSLYRTTPLDLAKKVMTEIAEKKKIPSTAGIGTNLFLAKVALDIAAKHNVSNIAYLDEHLYRKTLWDHTPITDFWQISSGTAERLEKYGIHTMREVAQFPEKLLYKTFGINAELLIDHANGRESCRMSDIKNYRTKSKSISFSQILPRNYSYEEARIIVKEMALHGSHELMKNQLISKRIHLYFGYASGLRPATKGSVTLTNPTNANSILKENALTVYDKYADSKYPIRRIGIAFTNLSDEESEEYDMFTNWQNLQKEKAIERTVMSITEKYGKNAVCSAVNFYNCATQRERNEMIGGHRAGYDDERRTG